LLVAGCWLLVAGCWLLVAGNHSGTMPLRVSSRQKSFLPKPLEHPRYDDGFLNELGAADVSQVNRHQKEILHFVDGPQGDTEKAGKLLVAPATGALHDVRSN
jgi:hypothetical protein